MSAVAAAAAREGRVNGLPFLPLSFLFLFYRFSSVSRTRRGNLETRARLMYDRPLIIVGMHPRTPGSFVPRVDDRTDNAVTNLAD